MTSEELQKLMLKVSNLFSPYNADLKIGGMNQEQVEAFERAWYREDYDEISEAIDHVYANDEEFAKKRIIPPPKKFQRHLRQPVREYHREWKPGSSHTAPLEEQRFNLGLVRIMTGYLATKMNIDCPGDFDVDKKMNIDGKMQSWVDACVYLYQEHPVMKFETYINTLINLNPKLGALTEERLKDAS